jgi:hypothetical protein
VLTFVAAVLAVHALVGHFRQSDQAHKEPPANVVEQLHKADRNMSAYCRGGHAWVERNTLSPDGWEVLGSCPREEVMR